MVNEKISVIIPAYNIESEIERCVNSVLSQTYSNIEIIVLNDGSKDGTLDVLRHLEKMDSRIKIIDKLNEGVTKARLTGVAAANGEWIGFVDGDDYIEPEMYERLLKNAKKYGADISHCGYQMVFPSRVDYYYNTGRLVEQDKITGLKDLLSGSFIEPGLWNKLFRKSLFQSLLHNDIMDLSIKNTEDLLMNYYLFKEAKKSVYDDFCPYHYIVRGTSAANKELNKHQLLDPLKVTEILMKKTADDYALQQIVEQKYVRGLISLATIKNGDNKELIAPIRKNARKKLRTELKKILFGQQYGMKLKIMTLWVAIWPASYCFIHDVYKKITGLDKIYEIS